MSSKAPMQDEIAAKAAISSFRKETHPRRQTKEEERRSAAYPCPQSEDRTSRLAPPIPRSGLVQEFFCGVRRYVVLGIKAISEDARSRLRCHIIPQRLGSWEVSYGIVVNLQIGRASCRER